MYNDQMMFPPVLLPCNPTKPEQRSSGNAVVFLRALLAVWLGRHMGFLAGCQDTSIFDTDLENAVCRLQRKLGVAETGAIDQETKRMLKIYFDSNLDTIPGSSGKTITFNSKGERIIWPSFKTM